MTKKIQLQKTETKRNKTVANRVKKNKEKFLEELSKVPILQVAYARVGINKATYYRWKEKDDEFRRRVDDALSEGESVINGLAESKVISGINNGDKTLTMFWLKNRHPIYRNNHFPKQADTPKETKGLSDERIAQIARSVKNWTKNLMRSSYDEEENDE